LYKILVGKPKRKRQLRIHGYEWKDNSRMDLREIGLEIVDRMRVAKDRDQW
jgi:hypothetical protein